jgi:hypothetical protein
VSAPLRWSLALAVVGALGFAAGHYFGAQSAPPQDLVFPVVATSGTTPSAAAPAASGAPRRVPATLREIMKLEGDFTQSAALHVLAASQDEEGIERLLDEAKSIGRGSERRAASSILYQRYAELDPEAAIDHMMRREGELDLNWLYAVFYSWARTDLDDALARAAKLDDRNRSMAGNAIVRSRDDLPPAEREALGSKLELRISVRDPSATDLRSPKAAERAWHDALAIGNRDQRQQELFAVAHAWAQQDPQAAIRAIESLRDRRQREMLLQIALQSWSQKSPREAAEWILARPPSQQRLQLLAESLGAYVAKAPSAAMEMLERLSPSEKQMMVPQVLMNWAGTDPRAAAAWLEKQDDSEVHRRAYMFIATAFAEQDSDEALRWAASLPEERAQEVMSQVIQRIAYEDPERAAGMLRQVDEGPQRDSAISNVALAWAQSDPRAALSWVEKQTRSDSTPDLYRTVFGQWAVYDAEAAASQLNFILESDTRNAAILGMFENASLDVGVVDRLYQRLDGAEARHQAAGQLYYRFRESDPQAAERYRIAAGITEGSEENLGSIVVN